MILMLQQPHHRRQNLQRGKCQVVQMLAETLLRKARNVEKMFDSRLNTAKALEQTMKIHRIVKVSNLKQEFDVLSTNTSRVSCKEIICNVPSCTCPNYQKNGMLVSCKHINFILLFVLKLDEELVRNARGTKTTRGTKNGP